MLVILTLMNITQAQINLSRILYTQCLVTTPSHILSHLLSLSNIIRLQSDQGVRDSEVSLEDEFCKHHADKVRIFQVHELEQTLASNIRPQGHYRIFTTTLLHPSL